MMMTGVMRVVARLRAAAKVAAAARRVEAVTIGMTTAG
jgi:hypothetical protein